MSDAYTELLEETCGLRRRLLEADVDLSKLRPFAITRDEWYALRQSAYLIHNDYERLASGEFEVNGLRFVASDWDGQSTTQS